MRAVSGSETLAACSRDPSLRWGTFVAEAGRVTRIGGHVAIYHVKQPPRPAETRLVRRIVILTRTWHAPRVCFVFEKIDPPLTLDVGDA